MNVLLIGSGGREHAIAWKLAQSKMLSKLYIAPGNAGTAKCGENVSIAATDIDKLVDFARQHNIGLVVVGPEDPLAAGVVDAMEEADIKAFGPSAGAAQLEADKAFAKQLMRSSAISTAEGRIFDRFSDAKRYIASRDEAVVIKAAGLAQGKGVIVCDDPADGILAAEKIMCDKIFGSAGDKIIVEEKLLGEETSILAFVDGHNIYVMESSQDHKPIGDGDTGPNTGGMGAYSPAPVVTEEIMNKITREILVPIVDGMNRNGTPYKGVLYAGLMITSGGPRVLEFNVRFGDPEAQPIFMRLKSDLLEVCLAVCDGRLDDVTLKWDRRPAVCVVMASGGYPGNYEKGKKITGLNEAERLEDVVVFHAGTKNQDGDIVTNGGRVLGVTALGEQIADAKVRAYEAVNKIKFDGAYWRRDIADKAIKKPPEAGISNFQFPISNLKIKNRKSKIENGGKVLTRLLFAGLILAGFLGFVLIWVWRALPNIAIAEISGLTNTKIDVNSVDFKFDGSVLINNLIIRPDRTRDERREIPAFAGTGLPLRKQGDENALLKAKTVYARFSIGSLLLLEPRLKEIRIDDFVFNAQLDQDTGRWNLAAFKLNVPKNGAGKMPLISLNEGTLQYSKISKGQVKVLAAVPIDMRFRPAQEILGGYSFDITTADRADSGRSSLVGTWRPGRIIVAGGLSSAGIPAFENAWVIDVLDAAVNYDRSNNFSLKLKIKDLLYTKESAGDTFIPPREGTLAFDRPTFLAKSGLFTALQGFFNRYNPTGKVDMDLEVSGNFNQLSESTVAGKVYCKDVVICDQKFPYAIEQVTGQVDFTENSAVLNNLAGKHGDVKVTFNGWVKDFGPNQRYQIQIASDNMALDGDLYNALSTKQKEFWAAFSPSGLAMIDYRASRQSQDDSGKTLAVELHGAEAAYRDFPYPLKNLTGKLFFDRDNIDIYDVASQANGSKIIFNGKVAERDTDRPIYYLSIKANDIVFDPTLAKTLLTKQGDFYNQFDITGTASADVKIFTPTEDRGPTSFRADLTLKQASLKANKSGLVVSDVSAKVNLTPDSTSIKEFSGRYGQSQVSLAGGIWLGSREAGSLADKTQLSNYYLALGAQQAQLSDELMGLLPAPLEKMVSQLQPAGKVNISASLRKTNRDDRPDYNITVECLGDSVNFKQFAYPLKDVTGTLKITNNKVAFDNITAAPADKVQRTTDGSTIKLNGQITLADNAFSEGRFQLLASDICFGNHLRCALPAGVGSLYQALSPTGRFDLDLENIKISKAPVSSVEDRNGGEKHIDFAGTVRFKACNFNMSGTQAELDAVLKTKGLYKTSSGLADGQISVAASNLKIKGKSITNVAADINYNRHLRNWLVENLLADCYGGRLTGKLEFSPTSGGQESTGSGTKGALEYLLQVGFDNINLKQFLLGAQPKETPKTGYTSGIMSGSLSIGAQVGDNSSRIGRCRLAIRDMQVGKLSPLAKLLSVLKLTEPKNFAFEQMVVDSYIRSNKLLFDKFDLSGETVAFHGSGSMDLQSENVNLVLTARGQRLAGAEPSFLESLTEGLGKAVVRMEVTGNVHDPKIETKTLPVVEDSLKILGSPR